MSLVADRYPEDQWVVAAEVVVHLREIDHRRIRDARQLAEAWMQVHDCDSAVLDSLDPAAREQYRAIVDSPRGRRHLAHGWSDKAALRMDVAHLNVALHRRLMVLQAALNDAAR